MLCVVASRTRTLVCCGPFGREMYCNSDNCQPSTSSTKRATVILFKFSRKCCILTFRTRTIYCSSVYSSDANCIPVYGGVYEVSHYHTPPWCGFPSSIARQPRGCQYRTTLFGSSRRDVCTADLFWHRHYSDCRDIVHGKSAQGCMM